MYDNPQSRPLYQQVQRASWLGLCVNLGLGIAKLTGGLIGNSFALVADAVNSLGDAVTTVIVLYSLKVAQRPADQEHPYGHTRAEGVAALSVSLLIIMSAAMVGWEALQRLSVQHGVPPWWTLWIAGANVLIKEALFRYKLAIGRRTGSMALIANAWDHRSDALCALAVLVGLSAIRLGGPNWMWADETAALVVVMLILVAATSLYLRSASELMDVQADPWLIDSVRQAAQATSGVLAIEKLWIRKSGIEYFVDIHIQVAPTLSVDAGHHIGHTVKSRLLDGFPAIRGVLVHLEPFHA
ncbi:MAG: cation transporter [Pirellulaceae bacterium]|nr:cation transporter [Pirellulaceae bacterium]